MSSNASKNNAKHDLCLGGTVICFKLAAWSTGNVDVDDRKIADNNAADALYSPLFGSFSNIQTALYFTVGATETLFDDAIGCAQKAFDCGVEVRCDIAPFMLHIWPEIGPNIFPEALEANVRAADWISQHLQ
jgi:acetyl esterase/lipase